MKARVATWSVARLLSPLLAALLPLVDARAFSGANLAVVGVPYTLTLPAGSAYAVAWGDGTEERSDGGSVTHRYAQSGVANITVKQRGFFGSWRPLTVDAAARIAMERPVFVAMDGVPGGMLKSNLLVAPADSFSFECRVNGKESRAAFPLLESAGGPGCRITLRDGRLHFELPSGRASSEPLMNVLSASTWHHLAVTYDRVPLFPRSNRVRFFVDGFPCGVASLPTDDAGAVSCPSATMGDASVRGGLGMVAVYDRLLFPLAVRDHARVLAGATNLPVTVAEPGSAAVTVDEPLITQTVEVALNADPAVDNGPILRQALAAAGPGTRVRIAGQGGTYFIRSLIAGNKWAGLLLEEKMDVEFDGHGNTLVYSDQVARYLFVDRCRRVAIRNLQFGLDPAYARVGVYAKLLEVDPAAQTVVAQLVHGRDGSPDPLIPRRATYWRWRPHDPRTLRIGEGGPYFDSGSYAEKPVADPARGPGVLRFRLKQAPADKLWTELKAYAAGPNFFLINNADFSANAVSLTDSSHVTFERVAYYATLGMVFLAGGVDHLRVAHCRIGLPPGLTAADRPLAAGADGYHFHEMRGGVLFEGNEVALTDDDPVSIKDSIWTDVRKVGERQLAGGKGIRVGHPVELLQPDYTPSGFTATVAAAEGDVLTLDRPLPAEVMVGSLLMDRSHHTTNWVLRDNYLHDYYGRVMLYSDHGTVTGNRVHGSFYHLGNSVAYFEKAGACAHVITHGNLFEATNADSSKWGGDQTLPAFHRVTYSANSFDGKGLALNNAADSLVARNLFEGEGATLAVKRGVRIRVLNNARFQPQGDFVVQGTNNTDLVVDGNVALRSP